MTSDIEENDIRDFADLLDLDMWHNDFDKDDTNDGTTVIEL